MYITKKKQVSEVTGSLQRNKQGCHALKNNKPLKIRDQEKIKIPELRRIGLRVQATHSRLRNPGATQKKEPHTSKTGILIFS